ncbi:glycosyltransferase family 4 protein [Pedobacter africanus]|uniref:Glycosyltransferase involved in cell wall bisynthesis n=1 Tax=Pedobacter africanus TaxID=151894 RepID=A0A1W2DFC0_9SPHI|nr:glycosyltransferase family 4 protein [Pedobacter africanus]SMC96197.1 Glycosyltransferase involved in cell wall bisynthesis [Pedobacter africanus]
MQKIAIISTCTEDWGGSEELWGRSIPPLQAAGFNVSVLKYYINRNHPEFVKLAERQVKLIEIFPAHDMLKRIGKKLVKTYHETMVAITKSPPRPEDFTSFIRIIRKESPSLVIISQGINFDGLKLAYQCLLLKIPYVVIAQKAVDFYWPHKNDRDFMLKALLGARNTFFVSKHNLRLTEEQFGKRLPNGKVIFNPVKLSGNIVPFPNTSGQYKLACLGRLFLLDKGQDMLIRILASEKWKARPLTVSFIGKGDDEAALKDMAALLGVKNVDFRGHIHDIEHMWGEYHALILPSRSEGLPLSMVEAMSAGRPVIISNAGGNAELVEEGVTGFIGYPDEASFEAAMERAWERREEWEQIGKKAAAFVRANVPKCPENDFAQIILNLVNK